MSKPWCRSCGYTYNEYVKADLDALKKVSPGLKDGVAAWIRAANQPIPLWRSGAGDFELGYHLGRLALGNEAEASRVLVMVKSWDDREIASTPLAWGGSIEFDLDAALTQVDGLGLSEDSAFKVRRWLQQKVEKTGAVDTLDFGYYVAKFFGQDDPTPALQSLVKDTMRRW